MASGNRHSFFRIMDLTGQTLVVNCFYNFIEGPPPVFIHDFSHLNCTMVGEGMQKPKNAVCQGVRKSQAPSWVSCSPDRSLNLQPLFAHHDFSDSEAGCCLLQGHRGGRSLEQGLIFFFN